MKTTHFTKIFLLTFLCAALAACTDASVTQLKASVLPSGEMTYGELLDQSKDCTGGEWAHRDGDSGGVTVTYTCNLEPSAAMIESARKDANVSVEALTKAFNDGWRLPLKHLQKSKEDAAQAAVRAGTQKESRTRQGQGQLQEAQNKLNQALASSPQQYIGHGPSGYTPQLLAEGRERMQTAINSAKREVEVARRKLEEAEAGIEPDSAYRNPALQQTRSAAEYQAMIDGMLSWKDRYGAAVVEAEARELKRAQAFLLAAKDQKRQVSISFLVEKQSVVPVQAKWISDGKDDGAINVFTSGLLQAPWRMHEVLEGGLKSRLSFVVDRDKGYASFPIVCGEKIPAGCELRKQSS